LTRRQLALAEAQQEPEATPKTDTVDEEGLHNDTPGGVPEVVSKDEVQAINAPETPKKAPQASEETPHVVEEISEEVEVNATTPTVGENASERQTLQALTTVPSLSPSLAQRQAEDPIEALDALEDAIDEVGKIIPGLDSPLSPEKPRLTKSSASKARAAPLRTGKEPVGGTSKTPATKAPTILGRASSLRTKTAPKIASTTQPSARVPPTAAPRAANGLARSTSTRPRPVSMIAPKSEAQSGVQPKAPDYLATKRRPISIQFPTPPPPPKSTKLPTQATFQLPGDAVAAKLKAARAERLKREEEEAAKKKEFKARPVPASLKSKPAEVKQTAASRARLSIAGAIEQVKDKENVTGMSSKGLKRSSTVTGALSNSTKRNSVIAGASKRSSVIGGGPGATIPSLKRFSIASEGQKAFSSSLSIPKRTDGPSANTSAKRLSSMASSTTSLATKSRSTSTASGPTSKAPISAQEVAAQRNKGREVFNRDRVEKDAKEKERKEKDEAMKKARADAAERGRQASRDWAEKQKRAALAVKGQAKVEQGAGASVVAEVVIV
jgi:hypothetical protein